MVVAYEGESVFNVLQREMRRNKIHMALAFRNTPINNSAYIEAVNNLYEFDAGKLSGWMYKVNDWFPNYGCSRYRLNCATWSNGCTHVISAEILAVTVLFREGRRMNDFVVSEALKTGFTKAVWLDKLEVCCEMRLRSYCNPGGCPNHGQNWVCPPGCGSIAECAERVSHFSAGIVLQSVSKLTPPVETDTYKALNGLHNFRLKELLERLSGKSAEMLVLTTGGCVFCEICIYPEPCIKPGVRMNSLSAYGIDVGRLCRQAGREYSFRPDKVYYTALVLVK